MVRDMQKIVYTTLQEAQDVAQYRSTKTDVPLWVYRFQKGYALTSRGHHMQEAPDAVMSLSSYITRHPSSRRFIDKRVVPSATCRLMYNADTNSFVQCFIDVSRYEIRSILKEPATCLIISLVQEMDVVRATELVNTLRGSGGGFAWFSFIYEKTILVTSGRSMNAARRPHYNAYYIHTAMGLPNTLIRDSEEQHVKSDARGES